MNNKIIRISDKNKMPKIVQCDKRGQVVIPKNIRKNLRLEDGAAFWIYETEDGIYLKKVEAPSKNDIKNKIKAIR